MLTIIAGRSGSLPECLISEAAKPLARGANVYVIVPKQLTLQTELELIRALTPDGSFALNVLSPERLCARIFGETGKPSIAKLDDRGRVMLCRAAIKKCESELEIYSGAQHRRGFPALAAHQLDVFRQAGLTGADVMELAEKQEGLAEKKTRDLARLLSAYEEMCAGRFEDGAAEYLSAAEACMNARPLDGDVIFYGFDIMPMPLNALMAALALNTHVSAIFPCNTKMGDGDIFDCVLAAIKRLMREAKLRGANTETRGLDVPEVKTNIDRLERYLFSRELPPTDGEDDDTVSVAALSDTNAEALYIAARAKEMAKSGIRWRDMVIMCPDLDACAQPITNAFADFGIPIFLTSSRASSRHPLAEAILSAIRLISHGWRTDDALALLRTGFTGVKERDADILANYLTRYAPRGRMLTRPFAIGDEAAEAEPMRETLISPVVNLRDMLREARAPKEQLAAIFGYLTEINAYDEALRRQKEKTSRGIYELAGEETQVWNRVMGTLDQAYEILGDNRLSLKEIEETLRESLDAAIVKPLPQQGDAVCAQDAGALISRRADCVFFMGLTDKGGMGGGGLISSRQTEKLARDSGRYLGPSDSDMAKMRRYYIKCALGAAKRHVFFTYPLAGADGQAQQPSRLISEIKGVLPWLEQENPTSEIVKNLIASAPSAATVRAANDLSVSDAGNEILKKLRISLSARNAAQEIFPDTAREIYGALERASVTRLEAFARCPFAHYVKYALDPLVIEPFELSARDEGSFFHEAVREFVQENMRIMCDMPPDDAARRMDKIADELMDSGIYGTLESSAVARAQKQRLKNTARVAARALVRQMRGSQFEAVELEVGFGGRDANALTLNVNGRPCALEGRVDRIDEWDGAEADYLRVIDYKRGGTQLKLGQAYLGLQLQLIMYLAAAMKRRGALGAGVYYFRVDNEILVTQETDPEKIEIERAEASKLKGLSINDTEVLRAMSPAPDDVITIRINKDGTISKSSMAASESGIKKLIDISMKNAAEDVNGIRDGVSDTAPVRTQTFDACAYCRLRAACLLDEIADSGRVRRKEEPSNSEMLEILNSVNDKENI